MSWIQDLSLLSSVALWAVIALVAGALLALVLLAFRAFAASGQTGSRSRARRWTQAVALLLVVAVVCAVIVLGFRYYLEKVWRPFPDPLPRNIYLWAAVGVLAIGVAVGGMVAALRHRRWRALVAMPLAAAVVVLGAAGGINQHFGSYPTVGSLLGIKGYREVSLADLAPRDQRIDPPRPISSNWSPPDGLSSEGAVARAPIPGVVSGFAAREAIIYVPPAYFAEPRPLLPVVVLMAGQPGSPEDWMRGGQLAQNMHRFAGENSGLAPVVVVVDPNGSELGNTLCVDSPRGKAQTYLSVDVPQWIEKNLQVKKDPQSRAIGGLSFGGTCALQLALAAPTVYPTFLDISGQAEPTLGDRQSTVRELFNGNEQAFREVNPADRLARQRFDSMAGTFIVGEADKTYRPGQEMLYQAAIAAGIDARMQYVPGGHDFMVWSSSLSTQLPWLAQRLGLVP